MRKFMRTRGLGSDPPHPSAHPQPLRNGNISAVKSNGHAKAAAPSGCGELPPQPAHPPHPHSPSRYWSGSKESRGREESLWEDCEFTASWRAIGDKKLAGDLVWVRPHEVCSRPTFLSEETEESLHSLPGRWCGAGGGAGGGPLADVHVRVAAGALVHTPRLLVRVAPTQSFVRQYTGAFRFRFWVFGTWRDVVVDDRLPARGSRLLAAHPTALGDFTLPLLEKAYAKLYGSYAALRAGSVSRALQDLTGGVVQSFALGPQPSSLTAQVLHSAVPRSTLLVAVVPPGKSGAARTLRNGLKSGCAYCVTGLARVRGEVRPDSEVLLVQMRAPTAACAEWGGAWSLGSAEWRALPPPDRDLLAHTPGHFWMSMAELRVSFGGLVLVHIGPDDWMREPALRDRRPWRAVLARRRWRRGYNAGGPPRALTTGTNPQFHLQIPGADKCHALVALAQHYSVGSRARDAELHAVGFAVYAVGAGGTPRRPAHDSLEGLRALDVTHESRAREVVTFFTLPPGQYLVVPHTRRPHTETSFLLRIFTDECAHVWEVNDDNMIIDAIGGECAPAGAVGAAGANRWSGEAEGEESEVGAAQLARWSGAPKLEVCRALVPLRDGGARGAVRPAEAAALVALCARWRAAFSAQSRCGSVCAYRLRAVLRSAGVSVSNKVLECVVVRFARRARLSADAFLLAVARLHLAHERHRILDAKLKFNPLSLEEMILMTVYS